MKRTNRQNLAVIGLSFTVFILLLLLLRSGDNRPQSSYREKTSSYFTDQSGTKAVYLVLSRLLPSVGRWLKPLDLLPQPSGDNPSTLMIFGPSEPLSEAEAGALDRWIEQGGQLILALDSPWPVVREEEPAEAYPLHHGFTFADSSVSDGAREYANPMGSLLLAGRSLSDGESTVLFGDRSQIKGAEKRVGAGRIVVIADRRAWSNERLRRSSNTVWLVATVFSWGNGRALIDEYHHGFQRAGGSHSLLLDFITSFWGLAFVQLACAGLLLLWLRGRRFGAPVEVPGGRVRKPLERVETLATLLATAKSATFAVQSIHQLLLRRLWQLRFGNLPERARSAVEQELGPWIFTERYRALLQRKSGADERDLYSAAREAGKIIREYKRGR